MAGLGFKDFAVGEVLTSADVDGYLMQQTVMRFADAGARGSALGTAVGTGVPLAEGMVTYLDDTNTLEVYRGTGWGSIGVFTAGTAITATDASWTIPALADPVVRVVCFGGGGGGGGAGAVGGGTGGTTTFACSAGTATATGGTGGGAGNNGGLYSGSSAQDLWRGTEGGEGARYVPTFARYGRDGKGGAVTVAYLDLTGVTTASVTIGAGGAGGSDAFGTPGGAGGDGLVLFEYRAA